ncbi:MAG: hypothetical protein IPP74_11360 [Alphaproteobacteria bacterium]|nr:hypothetical protein [Alphaproteobacteria bacterium]
MKITINLLLCAIITFIDIQSSYSSGIKEDTWWKNEERDLIHPVRISVIYLGYPIPGRPLTHQENYTKKLLGLIKKVILRDVDDLNNSTVNKTLSNEYLLYLKSDIAGKENFEIDNPQLPLDCGYIVIDKNNHIDSFPLDNPCKWLLYSFVRRTNRDKGLTLYLWSGVRPIPEVKGRTMRGVPNEYFDNKDPYYVQGLIRYLQQNGFRVTMVEEGVKFDSNDVIRNEDQ